MTRCNKCGAEWTSRKWEHCRECDQTFASTTAGDKHRVGEHAIYDGPGRRRCLEGPEMEALGMWATPSSQGVLVWHGGHNKRGVAERRMVPS